jgi:hypothetical protein
MTTTMVIATHLTWLCQFNKGFVMTMSPEIAQIRISNVLRDAETALDQALLTQSRLLTEMITARLETGQPAVLGQAEIMRLIKAQQALTTSGNDLARVHGGLLEIGREKAMIEDCPENRPIRGDLQADAA